MPQSSVADLTVDELKGLIRETVGQAILDIFGDPDEGLELREDVKEMLRRSLDETQWATEPVISAQDVADKLGLGSLVWRRV